MTSGRSARSRWPAWLAPACLWLGASGCGGHVADPAASQPASPAAEAVQTYRDPHTGDFGEPPPGVAPPAAPAAPPAALPEEGAPGGGRMIRLRGAFRSHFEATTSQGGLVATCGGSAGSQP